MAGEANTLEQFSSLTKNVCAPEDAIAVQTDESQNQRSSDNGNDEQKPTLQKHLLQELYQTQQPNLLQYSKPPMPLPTYQLEPDFQAVLHSTPLHPH